MSTPKHKPFPPHQHHQTSPPPNFTPTELKSIIPLWGTGFSVTRKFASGRPSQRTATANVPCRNLQPARAPRGGRCTRCPRDVNARHAPCQRHPPHRRRTRCRTDGLAGPHGANTCSCEGDRTTLRSGANSCSAKGRMTRRPQLGHLPDGRCIGLWVCGTSGLVVWEFGCAA